MRAHKGLEASVVVLKTAHECEYWFDEDLGMFCKQDRRKLENHFYMLCTVLAPPSLVKDAFERFVTACHREGRGGAGKLKVLFATAMNYLDRKKLEMTMAAGGSTGARRPAATSTTPAQKAGNNPYLQHIFICLEKVFRKNLVQVIREELLPTLQPHPGFLRDVVEEVQSSLTILCPLSDDGFVRNFSMLKFLLGGRDVCCLGGDALPQRFLYFNYVVSLFPYFP